MTLILHEKIGNILFIKWNIFLYLKIDSNYFYPKIPTGAQISTQPPTLTVKSSIHKLKLVSIRLSIISLLFATILYNGYHYTRANSENPDEYLFKAFFWVFFFFFLLYVPSRQLWSWRYVFSFVYLLRC